MKNPLRSRNLYRIGMLETYCFIIASEYHIHVQLIENTGQLLFENSSQAHQSWTA